MNNKLLDVSFWIILLTTIHSSKYIKILTGDRQHELMLVDKVKGSERFVFVHSSGINGQRNVFIYDTKKGGIRTDSNVYISRRINLHKLISIEPEYAERPVNDWKILSVGPFNRIRNSEGICLKKGFYTEEDNGYLLEPDKCSEYDPLQQFIVIEIPLVRDDMCDLMNLEGNCPLFKEQKTDILNAPGFK